MRWSTIFRHDPLFAAAWTIALVGCLGFLTVLSVFLSLPHHRAQLHPMYWRDWFLATSSPLTLHRLAVAHLHDDYVLMANEAGGQYTGWEVWRATSSADLGGGPPVPDASRATLKFPIPFSLSTTVINTHTRPRDSSNWLVTVVSGTAVTLFTYSVLLNVWQQAHTMVLDAGWTAADRHRGAFLELADGSLRFMLLLQHQNTQVPQMKRLQAWTYQSTTQQWRTDTTTIWTAESLELTQIVSMCGEGSTVVVVNQNVVGVTQGLHVFSYANDRLTPQTVLPVPAALANPLQFGYVVQLQNDLLLASDAPRGTATTITTTVARHAFLYIWDRQPNHTWKARETLDLGSEVLSMGLCAIATGTSWGASLLGVPLLTATVPTNMKQPFTYRLQVFERRGVQFHRVVAQEFPGSSTSLLVPTLWVNTLKRHNLLFPSNTSLELGLVAQIKQ